MSARVLRVRRRQVQVLNYDRTTFRFCPVAPELDTVRLYNGYYLKDHAATNTSQPKYFPGIELTIGPPSKERWAIVGPAGAGKTTLLGILQGRYQAIPNDSRDYPALNALAKLRKLPIDPLPLISYVGPARRDGHLAGLAGQGAYLSARFESLREASDLTLTDYLAGNVHLNPDGPDRERIMQLRMSVFYNKLIDRFQLKDLVDQPLSRLSNGQTRRARIARSLVPRPGLLLLDEPFVGLDPLTQRMFKDLFIFLSTNSSLGIVCTFEDLEEIPRFVTHIAFINANHELVAAGPHAQIVRELRDKGYQIHTAKRNIRMDRRHPATEAALAAPRTTSAHGWWLQGDAPACQRVPDTAATPVVEMSGIRVRYGGTIALGGWRQEIAGVEQPGLWWKVRQGERWGVFGPNGAGKTTLLALISSDHPQAYSQPLRVFGRTRLPSEGQPGLSIFDLQSRIGQASPEIHNFFPRHLSVRQTLESAWAETFRSVPLLTHERDLAVDATLRWFQPFLDPSLSQAEAGSIGIGAVKTQTHLFAYLQSDVEWAENLRFSDLDFGGQRVLLFLRSVIHKPDIVVLDEAFSGMSTPARVTCMTWLAYGERRQLHADKVGYKKRISILEKHDTSDRYSTGPKVVCVEGLEPRQTLLCVAHRREDVPPLLSHWIMLPPDGGRAMQDAIRKKTESAAEVEDSVMANGVPPRFGRFDFTTAEWRRGNWWESMWLMGDKKKQHTISEKNMSR